MAHKGKCSKFVIITDLLFFVHCVWIVIILGRRSVDVVDAAPLKMMKMQSSVKILTLQNLLRRNIRKNEISLVRVKSVLHFWLERVSGETMTKYIICTKDYMYINKDLTMCQRHGTIRPKKL